ncbi:hypothetical protein HK097_002201 [Rhizophlyctis rosea]|uniref:Uncharacterized protein n=1 Tax=Rhizophlyctis rosea TaxID=64517 RepID=A0AAD5S5N8_9FUNG|nr:hypothetical protein HK097_002201 [Rhizophlyctis rosea]
MGHVLGEGGWRGDVRRVEIVEGTEFMVCVVENRGEEKGKGGTKGKGEVVGQRVEVWNLLTCTVWWSVNTTVTHLFVDHKAKQFLTMANVEKGCALHLFDPKSPIPIHSHSLDRQIISASLITPTTKTARSKLIVLNDQFELVELEHPLADRSSSLPFTVTDSAPAEEESEVPGIFSNLYKKQEIKVAGAEKRFEGVDVVGGGNNVRVGELLSAPSHVVPPVSRIVRGVLEGWVRRREEVEEKGEEGNEGGLEEMEVDDLEGGNGMRETERVMDVGFMEEVFREMVLGVKPKEAAAVNGVNGQEHQQPRATTKPVKTEAKVNGTTPAAPASASPVKVKEESSVPAESPQKKKKGKKSVVEEEGPVKEEGQGEATPMDVDEEGEEAVKLKGSRSKKGKRKSGEGL